MWWQGRLRCLLLSSKQICSLGVFLPELKKNHSSQSFASALNKITWHALISVSCTIYFIKLLKSTMTWDKMKLDLIRRWDHCHPVWMWRHTVLSIGHYSFLRFIPRPCDSYGRCLKRDITFFQLHFKPANRVISEQETSVPPCAWVKKDRQNRRSFWGKRLLECCGTYSEILGSFIWPFVVEWLWNVVIRFLSVEV